MAYYAPRGLMIWGEPVTRALAMGELAVRAAGGEGGGGGGANSGIPAPETHRPVTLLLEGAPKAGKTALAVEIARRSGFPFVKIVTSHKMIGYTETAKCMAIKKVGDLFDYPILLSIIHYFTVMRFEQGGGQIMFLLSTVVTLCALKGR